MKKLYTTLLAALATIISMSAQEPVQALDTYKASTKVTKQAVKRNQNIGTMLQPYAADVTDLSIDALAGEYDWKYYNYLSGNAGGDKTGLIEIEITDKATGKVTMTLNESFVLEGTYDVASATLSVATNQDLGYNEYNEMEVYLYHKRWNSNGRGNYEVDEPFTFTFDGNALSLPLTEGTDDLAGQLFDFEIIAIGNSSKGWFLYAGENVISKPVPYEDRMPEGTWKSVGKGTFTDSWQVIGYTGPTEYANYPWEVDVEQNESNPSIYRIVNPYGTNTDCPIAKFNTDANKGEGYIVFSIENPEYVMVYPYIYAGLEDEYGTYLNYNMEGFLTILYGLSPEEVIANADMLEITEFSTYKDGIITFQNCVFGMKDAPELATTWVDEQNQPMVAPGYLEITLPTSGIEDVISNNKTKAEYYNLQGIRVEKPTAGQVVIKRQGTKVTKVIVK